MLNRNSIIITLLLIAGTIIVYSFFKDVDRWVKASAYLSLIVAGILSLFFNRKK